jgi:hypothetical protein
MSLDNPLNQLINEKYYKESLEHNDNLLFKQYKFLMEMSNDLCNRRDSNIKFYATISSIIVGLTSYLITNNYPLIILLIPVILGIPFCYIWYRHIADYKELNSAKFKVINHIENYLPAKGFTIEWDLINHDKYKGLTYWDKVTPLLFMFILIIILIGLLIYNSVVV